MKHFGPPIQIYQNVVTLLELPEQIEPMVAHLMPANSMAAMKLPH